MLTFDWETSPGETPVLQVCWMSTSSFAFDEAARRNQRAAGARGGGGSCAVRDNGVLCHCMGHDDQTRQRQGRDARGGRIVVMEALG